MPSVNNTIENNYIEWFGYGISLYGSRNNSINLNDFSTYEDSCPMYLGQHYTGYEYLYSDYNTISDNDFSGGPPIIEFSHSSNNTISRNQMGGWGALLLHSASNNNNIINNTINGCLQAIEIYSCNQNIIRGNHFEGDPSVIYFFQCFNNSIIENTFVNNGDYLQFSNSSYNKIYHNNFFQDYPPIIDAISQNIWDNGYPSGGNYWSGYTGIDANHDGIGDTPYVIDANNIDRYPLMNPWESQISANAYLVARGLDNVIYYRTWDTSTDTWLPWNSLPGVTCDSIAATVYDNRLHLVVRGLDGNSLWHGIVKLTDNSFSGWVYLDGASSSAPTLTSDDTTMCLVVRGLDNAIYYRTFNPFSNNWNAWSSLPGTTCDSPSAALLDGKLHIVVRGLDGNSLWHSTTDIASDAFSGWQIVEGATNSKPTLTASDGNDQVYLVVRGLDSVIYYKTWTAQGWLGWSAIMQGISCDGPAATTNENKLYLIVRGADGNSIYYGAVQLPTKAFSGWTNLSGITPSKPTLT
jgi:parallel beta-helix repeat protein